MKQQFNINQEVIYYIRNRFITSRIFAVISDAEYPLRYMLMNEDVCCESQLYSLNEALYCKIFCEGSLLK